MRTIMSIFLLLSLGACTSHTEHGECVGLLDQHKPNLNYEVSVWNGFVAIVFGETIIVPLYTLAKQIQCPVSEKPSIEQGSQK